MSAKFVRAFVATGALAMLCASWGCVADRPSRNGVYNENQYLRKAFIVRSADQNATDPGWMLKATVVSASSPNPLGALNLGTGAESGGAYVRFNVTSDKLQMLNLREMDQNQDITNQGTRTAEVVNAWPATNVDLKYRVNLDGEKTNFYEENQELDWQQRQWVKVNFDKNDMSDLAPLGSYAQAYLNACTDVSSITTTLVPGSFLVDEANNYVQWTVQVTVPIKFDSDATTGGPGPCSMAYGDTGLLFQRLGRNNVTLNLMYSMTRAVPDANITYQPLEIAEKDNIRKKYGTIDFYAWARDLTTGLPVARQLAMRFDPSLPNVWYLAQGFPSKYYYVFTCNASPNTTTPIVTPHGEPCKEANTIEGATNAIFMQAGAATRIKFLNYNDKDTFGDAAGPSRVYGDVRYSFYRWITDIADDTGNGYLGVTQFVPDPRTGQVISSSVNIQNDQLEDFVLTRLEFYLSTLGAMPATNPDGSWMDPPSGASCQDGDTVSFDPATEDNQYIGNSTVFNKIQTYLHKPVNQYGKLSPSDFIIKQDQDFFNAYYTLLPYEIFADPTTNAFTVPEGTANAYAPTGQLQAMATEAKFQNLMAGIDKGFVPYDVDSPQGENVKAGLGFLNSLQQLTLGHRDYNYAKMFGHPQQFLDTPDMVSYLDLFKRDARHCVDYGDGKGAHWEQKDEYEQNLINSYWKMVLWHEFGHTLGMNHNFMASVDQPNWPHYTDGAGRDHIGTYESSIMEYNSTPDRVFWAGVNGGGWGPYDQGAIGFMYANNQKKGDVGPYSAACASGCSVSGQTGNGQDPNFTAPPWKDPYGFQSDGKTEIQYLYCDERHIKYTPLCRTFDFGATPSEIVASQIDSYEWNYKWRNYRLYHKFFNFSSYPNAPANLFTELRRFAPQWEYDWSAGELANTFRRLNLNPPSGTPANTYYNQLGDKFNSEMSISNQLIGAYHKAIVQQSSGERPFKSIYDQFFGDVTQQGIVDDKILAIQGWTALWPTDNYDPGQAQGGYFSSYGSMFGDTAFQSVSEDTVNSMIGGQFDIYPYGHPLAVLQFAQATTGQYFQEGAGRPEVKDWIGGKMFDTDREFLDYLHQLAVDNNMFGCKSILDGTCTWDPTQRRAVPTDLYHSDTYNQFLGPDGRRYIWAYVQDRNTWVLADRDRNTASFIIIYNYTADIINAQDDGNVGPAYFRQYEMKYYIDYFNTLNGTAAQ
jgi:hypothetical protein